MKKFLVLAILLPVIAYVPFLLGGYMPVWLNVTIFLVGIVGALASNIWHILKPFPKRKAARILTILGLILYIPILFGLIDLVAVMTGGDPLFITGGDGWQDLVVFISWTLFIIPPVYIIGTILIAISRRIGR